MEENIPPAASPPPVAPPPPPLPPPPVITRSAPPPPPSRGRGWMVFAIVLLVLLAFSVLYNIGNFARNIFGGGSSRYYTRVAGPRLDEIIREDHDAVNKIAMVEISGIIMGGVFEQGGLGMVDLVKAQLKRAEDDPEVKAVVLRVDSPGGEVMAADEISRALSEFQGKSGKPVVASMGSVAASGGYYVSAPCRWIVANELTITGSIGVILSSWNYRHLMDKVGVVPETYKSGKFKDMLSGSREPESISPEEVAMVKALINETFEKFKSVVQKGRDDALEKNKKNRGEQDKGRALDQSWQDYADGRVLSGKEAFKLGFVDELGSLDAAVKRASKLAGISRANLIEYRPRHDLSDLFQLLGKSDATTVKIDLGMDMPKLQAGRLYFLAPTFVH